MEELNLDFPSHPTELLSLQELSLAAAASVLWGSKETEKAMAEVLDKLWRDHSSLLNMEGPRLEDLPVKISDTVSRIFNEAKGQMSFPQVLKTEVEKKLLATAEEVSNWILYLIRDLQLDYKAAERIYLTTDGHIDEDKIFRFFWSDRLAEEPVKWDRFDNNLTLLQYLACFFGQEEFITLHQSDFIEAIKPLESENNDIVLTVMKSVIAYFNAYYNDLNFLCSKNFAKRVKFHIVNISTSGMLSICKRFYFYKAFLFFWKRLNATERSNYLETESNTQSSWRNEDATYGTEQSSKIMLFLMDQMNERQRYNLILNNFSDVIVTFLKNKNCKTFCVPLVKHLLPIINETEKSNLLTYCADICNNSIQFDIELEIVKCLLKNVPIKSSDFHVGIYPFPEFNYNVSRTIQTFFANFKLPVLQFIIKDESSEKRKKDLIKIGEMKYREFIQNNNFQLLDKFLDEVLSSEAEKHKFKQDYNFLREWIAQSRFDIVDNVLIWIHGAASQEFKTGYINLFYSFTPKNYEAIEKLLIWFFDAQGPLINNCQNKLELLNEFCSGLIYNLWFPEDYNIQLRQKVSNLSTKILIFSFSFEKEIDNFKTNVLANEERFIKFLSESEWLKDWYCNEFLSALDGFLNFCNLAKEKRDYIRNSILCNEEWRKWADTEDDEESS